MREMTLEEMAMVTGGMSTSGDATSLVQNVPTITVTANPNNSNYLQSVLNCFQANWATNLLGGMAWGGAVGAFTWGVAGAAASLGIAGAPAAVAGGTLGAAAGALTSVPSTALQCVVFPHGATPIGGYNSKR